MNSEKKPTPQPSLASESTYQIDGRAFVVQPIFQQEGDTTLISLLLDLMQADAAS